MKTRKQTLRRGRRTLTASQLEKKKEKRKVKNKNKGQKGSEKDTLRGG